MKVFILRSNFKDQTLGNLLVIEDTDILFQSKTLELPDLNNERRKSCIPEGVYTCVKHTSPKFGTCIWVQNVPNRDEILMHAANFKMDLLGCIGQGDAHIDINSDGLKDITNSKKTMERFLKVVPNTFQLVIRNMK
jgi:hypothetical protein